MPTLHSPDVAIVAINQNSGKIMWSHDDKKNARKSLSAGKHNNDCSQKGNGE